MDNSKRTSLIVWVLWLITILAIFYVVLKYLFPLLLPFIIGFIIATLARPVAKFINKKIKLPYKISAAIVLIVYYAIISVAIWFFVTISFTQLTSLFTSLPQFYESSVKPVIDYSVKWVSSITKSLPPSTAEAIELVINSTQNTLTQFMNNFSTNVINIAADIIKKVPMVVVILLFTVISSFFICLDYSKITSFIIKGLPKKISNIVLEVRLSSFSAIIKILRAYFILMLITFTELSIGFVIIRLDYAITIAALIALADFLPLVGTFAIMIPWIFFEAITGDIKQATSLLVLYIIVEIVRNFLEAKIVGANIGIHPVVTLLAIFIGFELFGFIGIFLLPLIIVVIKKLSDTGVISFKKVFQ